MSATVQDSQDRANPAGDPVTDGQDSSRRARQLGRSIYHFAILPVLGVTGTLALWWWLTWFFDIRTFFLPSPPDVASALHSSWSFLADEAWVTVYETAGGFALGAAAGLLGATLLTSSQTIERAMLPLVVALNAIPKVALAPLLLIWLGREHAPKVALAALICFFPIMIAAMAGLTSTPAELGELARSLSASKWQTFVKVRVPWALPQVFVGLKLGITLSVIGTVVAQMASPTGGLGTVILLSGQNANTSLAFAAITLLMIISIVLFYTVVLAERLLLPWARATTATRV